MTIGLVGRKAGMTRIFTDDGASVPVTVIEIEPNRVTQVRSAENDGYRAVQVTVGSRRASRVTKPMAGHYAKVLTASSRRWTVEIRRFSPDKARAAANRRRQTHGTRNAKL